MALFALPLTASSTTTQSAETRSSRYRVTLPSRKRKRGSESPPPDYEEENLSSSDDDLPAASTNPLSLRPAEVVQYQLAGLDLNQEIPDVRDFPHRPLPTSRASIPEEKRVRKGSKKGKEPAVESSDDEEQTVKHEGDEEASQTRPPHGSRLRTQHFRVLVAILHKCLLEGDIKRALRALTMLLRVQYGGEKLDIRSTGYWAIGAELLARSTVEPRHDPNQPQSNPDALEDGDGEEIGKTDQMPGREKEWGTKTGRAKAVDYLGSIVLEFPHNKQYWRTISAIDFWPSMLAIEIYGIQFEQRQALRRIAAQRDTEESEEESEDDEDSGHMDSDDSYAAAERKIAKRKNKMDEKAWKERDGVRKTTLAAAKGVATRMDELLTDPLYTGNITISEIRAHTAMYIGDLSVPEKFPGQEDGTGSQRLSKGMNTDKRMIYRRRINEYEAGKKKRKEETERAKTIVKKLQKDGGNVDDFKYLGLGEDDEDNN